VIGGTLRRVSPPVVSCNADTNGCAQQIDQFPTLTADGRVVYEHEGGLVGQICGYYDCGVYGDLSSAFLVQSDIGGDTPTNWATSNGDGTGGQYQVAYPLDAPSADPGNADLVAYPGLEDYNCSAPDQAYSETNQGSGPFYGTGWWLWRPSTGVAVGQGGAITSDTPAQGTVIFTYNGDIVSIPGSCWGGTPTVTAGQSLPPTIAATCTSGTNLTGDGQDDSPTWTSSTATIGISSNNGPPPGGKATSTLGKVGVSGTSVSVSLKCSAGSGDCADTLGLGTDETLRGSKVVAVAASKTRHKVLIVGAGRVTLAAGRSETVKLSLDGACRKLLKKFHKLPVLVIAVQGSRTFGSHKVTFRYHG
jgi:hypothetical protein